MKAFIAYRHADGSFGELEPLNNEAKEQEEKTFSEKETDAFAHIVLDAMLRNKDKVKSWKINFINRTSRTAVNVREAYVLGNLLVIKHINGRRTFIDYHSIKRVRKLK